MIPWESCGGAIAAPHQLCTGDIRNPPKNCREKLPRRIIGPKNYLKNAPE
jgi:hypothetical protein